MKKIYSTVFISIIAFGFFGFIGAALAIDEYVLLAPIPGLTKNADNETDLTTYIQGAFNLAITIGAMLAFVMITYGGIMYATTDAIGQKEEGRQVINNALLGLLLVLSSWVILYTINPDMIKFDLTLKRPDIQPVRSVVPGVPMTQDEIDRSETVRRRLGSGGVEPYMGPCTQGQTEFCVNLNGLPGYAIDALINLNNACGRCGVLITGGTEGGHTEHGVDAPVVDLRRTNSRLNTFIMQQPVRKLDTGKYPIYEKTINNQRFQFMDEGDHWHVRIAPNTTL